VESPAPLTATLCSCAVDRTSFRERRRGLSDLPHEADNDRPKYDGWRMLAYKDGRTVRLVSRRGRDHTATFPDIALAVASLPTLARAAAVAASAAVAP
jgi:hypothetical protein